MIYVGKLCHDFVMLVQMGISIQASYVIERLTVRKGLCWPYEMKLRSYFW